MAPQNRIRAVQLLLNKDPENSINKQNKRGDTLLHLAVRINDTNLISFLFKRFGKVLNPSVKNRLFQTPLSLARTLHRTQIIRLLSRLIK